MPYRIDVRDDGDGMVERLIDLGALDVERSLTGAVAALMPDSVTPAEVGRALGVDKVAISRAVGRDAESVWLLTPRPVRVGRIEVVPSDAEAGADAVRLIDAPVFGTGLHPTTTLCLEALDGALGDAPPDSLLDVGTGSGVLALAGLIRGVRRASAIDTDPAALEVAAANARLNGVAARLELVLGGPDVLTGTWPLVLANVLAAPLIEMAPALARRVGHHGRLVLSGIPDGVGHEVEQAYVHQGMKILSVRSRGGWVALVLTASW